MPTPSPRAAASAVAALVRAGLLAPPRPDHALGMAAALALWGVTPPGGYAAHAARSPRRAAVVDPAGTLTYLDVDRMTTAIAAGLRAGGVRAGDPVGVLCGNDRGFVLAVIALGKVGATAVLLNTGFAAPQVAEVAASEGLTALLRDPALPGVPGLPEWTTPDLLALAAEHAGARPRPPREPGRFVILTSGTTGRPKGAHRAPPTSLEPLVALLSAIPLRAGETTVVAPPLFHAWGFAQWLIAMALGSTVVLTGSFDAERTLAAVETHRATALVAVPVMLRRLLAVGTAYDTSSLRVVAVSGSALPPDLATAFLDAFGDVLYDLYGSTEVAWASIASPRDLREAPGSVGRPPLGTRVEIVDADGGTGRIFVGNALMADMPGREVRDGLMATGDLGRFDADGRLWVVGREDDMVVSGGENVFPRPVEEALAALPGVADVAVVGVPDEEYGQRLRAVVVRAPGARLTADDVRDAVRARLGRHYVPRDVVFADALPRNAAGKVVARDLPPVDA
ncbi:MAG TPA: AMP-binding protein [Mycobacteriales bacterium]|nr:AMP-binding protein [Mycobacteriales bacterium]